MPAAVHLVRRLEQIRERHGMGDVLEELHPLVVLDPLGLHRRDRLAPGLGPLGVQHRARIVQGALDDGQDVERVRRRLPVEQLDRGQGER